MPYRMMSDQGDYASGGYGYRGDPGLFSFLGKAVKTIWKVGKPIVGAMLGGAMGAQVVAPGQQVAIPAPPPVPGAGAMPGGGLLPAAGQFVGSAIAGYQGAAVAGGVCPVGFHPRKDRRLPFKCVRNRRMNIANPRALRRGMRRVQGFEKLARKTISFTRRVKMKKRSRG